jgi:hypothetical protein
MLNMNASVSALSLFLLLQNISLNNNSIDSYLPKLVEILSWVFEVDRCSIFLYNSEKKCLYLKASTGRITNPIELKKKDAILSEVFSSGQLKIFKRSIPEKYKAD